MRTEAPKSIQERMDKRPGAANVLEKVLEKELEKIRAQKSRSETEGILGGSGSHVSKLFPLLPHIVRLSRLPLGGPSALSLIHEFTELAIQQRTVVNLEEISFFQELDMMATQISYYLVCGSSWKGCPT